MGKVLHTPMDILRFILIDYIIYIFINANCDHSFPMHTDLEIQVPTVENLALSNVLHLRPGIGQNVAMHASPIATNDKLLSLSSVFVS